MHEKPFNSHYPFNFQECPKLKCFKKNSKKYIENKWYYAKVT